MFVSYHGNTDNSLYFWDLNPQRPVIDALKSTHVTVTKSTSPVTWHSDTTALINCTINRGTSSVLHSSMAVYVKETSAETLTPKKWYLAYATNAPNGRSKINCLIFMKNSVEKWMDESFKNTSTNSLHNCMISALAISKNGDYLLCGEETFENENKIVCYELNLSKKEMCNLTFFNGHSNWVRAIAFPKYPCNADYMVSSSDDHTLVIWKDTILSSSLKQKNDCDLINTVTIILKQKADGTFKVKTVNDATESAIVPLFNLDCHINPEHEYVYYDRKQLAAKLQPIDLTTESAISILASKMRSSAEPAIDRFEGVEGFTNNILCQNEPQNAAQRKNNAKDGQLPVAGSGVDCISISITREIVEFSNEKFPTQNQEPARKYDGHKGSTERTVLIPNLNEVEKILSTKVKAHMKAHMKKALKVYVTYERPKFTAAEFLSTFQYYDVIYGEDNATSILLLAGKYINIYSSNDDTAFEKLSMELDEGKLFLNLVIFGKDKKEIFASGGLLNSQEKFSYLFKWTCGENKEDKHVSTLCFDTTEMTTLNHIQSMIYVGKKNDWLITGSKNKKIIIWNVSKWSGRELPTRLHTFLGHTDSVKSLSFDHGQSLLVSGSKDRQIFFWDVKLAVVSQSTTSETTQIHKCPVIFPGWTTFVKIDSTEATERIIVGCSVIHPENREVQYKYHLSQTVLKCLQSADVENRPDNKDGCRKFLRSINKLHIDDAVELIFFVLFHLPTKFNSALVLALYETTEVPLSAIFYKVKKFLLAAQQCNDVKLVRVVLNHVAFFINNSTKIEGYEYQDRFFDDSEPLLEALSQIMKIFSNEVLDFLKTIDAIESSPLPISMQDTKMYLRTDAALGYTVIQVQDHEDIIHTKELEEQTCPSAYAKYKAKYNPLGYADSRKILPFAVKFSDLYNFFSKIRNLSDNDKYAARFFDNLPMKALLQLCWDKKAEKRYRFQLGTYLLILVLFAAFSVYRAYTNNDYWKLQWRAGDVLLVLLVILGGCLLFFHYIFQPLRRKSFTGPLLLRSIFGGLFIPGMVCIITFFIPGCVWFDVVLAYATTMYWMGLFYYLRVTRRMGPFIRTMIQMLVDIRYFCIVLVLAIAAATNAFFLLLNDNQTCRPQWNTTSNSAIPYAPGDACYNIALPYSNVREALFTVFNMFMLNNNYDNSYFNLSSYPAAVQVLFSFFIIVVTIILLNLLIAIMGASYKAISLRAELEVYLYRADIFLEEEPEPEKKAFRVHVVYPIHKKSIL